MSIKTITKRYLRVFSSVILLFVALPGASQNQTTDLPLVGNIVATLIDNPPFGARANDIVIQALANYNVSVTATTQAWVGSGLRNGKFVGFIDHYSLDAKRANFLYSEPYIMMPLHLVSRQKRATEAVRLDKVYRTSVGIENRFANTDELRGERSVRWARSPDFLSNITQVAGRRVDFILVEKFMVDAFNSLLVLANKEPLYISNEPLYEVELRLAIKSDFPNAQNIINDFNKAIAALRASGEIDKVPSSNKLGASMLDEVLYQDIVRRW